MRSLFARLALVAVAASFAPLMGCSAATGDDEETIVGEDEDGVDFEGESVTVPVPSGTQLKATANVNIRSGASTGYKILKVIPNGATVTVVNGTPNGAWYNVKYAGVTGWSHGAYFDRVATSPPPSGGGTDCKSRLTALGVTWSASGATKGINNPVRVSSPIHGVAFRYVASTTSSPVLVDCTLGLKLAAAADKMKAYGVTEFTHIGTYNYRYIAGTTKLSNHSFGTAIDIAGMRANGAYYSLDNNNHFVKNTASATCSQARTTAGDKVLKGWACDANAAGVFNIILTPNYNTAHRNHFHVDLTAGANMIKADEGTAGTGFDANTVDPFSLEPLGDGIETNDVDVHDDVPQELFVRELEIQRAAGAVVALPEDFSLLK